eukprot:484314_1
MFKFLGNKLFGGPKKQENKPKHRLTISIPSTKYDPPSKHTSKHSSNTSFTNRSNRRTHSPKPKKKPKSSKHNKSNSKSNIQQLNTTLNNGAKSASSSALNSPFKPHIIDATRPIFQRSGIFNLNSALKFEITVQYQQQMWTVYKTLCDFIELYNKLKLKYTQKEAIKNNTQKEAIKNNTQKEAIKNNTQNNNNNSNNNNNNTVEVPPLLPLGLF